MEGHSTTVHYEERECERERESNDEANGQRSSAGSGAFFTGYGVFNPGYSFARPPELQNKPSTKRPRIGKGNATSDYISLKPEPESGRFRELSIKEEPGEDLYGLEPGAGRLRRINLPVTETPIQGNSNSPDVQTQALVHHSLENDRSVVTESGHSEDETSILSTIKEKLHNAVLGLTSNEPTPPPDFPHGANTLRVQDHVPKCAAPYSDTKMANTVVDLTVSKITELSPYQVEMTNLAWEKAVEEVIAKVVKKLKVPGGVANVGFMPCNLTLCGPGDMAKKHQEPKREPGVFGTLTICLPSKHEGGDLIVTHDDQSSSQVVQSNLSNVFNTANTSGITSNGGVGLLHVDYRFAAILMPQEYFVDFHFESGKSSTAAMSDTMHTLASVFVSSNGDEISNLGLKRACQLVLEQTKHMDDNENSTTDDNNTPASGYK
ncbi:hypothetical protein V491_03050 [Pseudogymnoascus sp. VKM F-3775]|nr:hypothetical protein V491_03050 [Pseudogymnoascus sp. VKM F-3775]